MWCCISTCQGLVNGPGHVAPTASEVHCSTTQPGHFSFIWWGWGLDGDIGMLLSSGQFSGFRLPAMVRWSELLIMSVLCVFGVGTKLPVHGRWVCPFYWYPFLILAIISCMYISPFRDRLFTQCGSSSRNIIITSQNILVISWVSKTRSGQLEVQ